MRVSTQLGGTSAAIVILVIVINKIVPALIMIRTLFHDLMFYVLWMVSCFVWLVDPEDR